MTELCFFRLFSKTKQTLATSARILENQQNFSHTTLKIPELQTLQQAGLGQQASLGQHTKLEQKAQQARLPQQTTLSKQAKLGPHGLLEGGGGLAVLSARGH